ncbi:MAG: gliding motility-associated C-terminal domain-containing protein [Bacteroidota bacterium]
MQLTLLLTLAWSCKDDDMSNDEEPLNIYENCCEAPGVDISIGQGNIFIPNIFTPNGDGINDFFTVFTDEDITQIKVFKITDGNKDAIYEFYNFPPDLFTGHWFPSEDEATNGRYDYEFTIESSDGVTETVTGNVCVYRCKTDVDFILEENIPNCQFGTQHDGAGDHNALAPSLEDADCF